MQPSNDVEDNSFTHPAGLRGVEAKAEARNLASPPPTWMNPGDAAADQVARMMADRKSRMIAATESGMTEPLVDRL